MKKYDAQKAQAKFEKNLNKVAQKLDKADEKGRELSIILLRCKLAKLANKRARELEKFETNGVSVKPEFVLDKNYVVRFKVWQDVKALSADEADKICGVGDGNYQTLHAVSTSKTNSTKNKQADKSL